jgi:hypothetical protein
MTSDTLPSMSDMVLVEGIAPEAGMLPALDAAAEALGLHIAYEHHGAYHFSLGGGESIALSPDSADRIRVERCHLCRSVSTMWVLAQRLDRLAGLIERMSQEVREPA